MGNELGCLLKVFFFQCFMIYLFLIYDFDYDWFMAMPRYLWYNIFDWILCLFKLSSCYFHLCFEVLSDRLGKEEI